MGDVCKEEIVGNNRKCNKRVRGRGETRGSRNEKTRETDGIVAVTALSSQQS